jgi:hypothetical protein
VNYIYNKDKRFVALVNFNFILQLCAEGGKASKCELRKSREKKMKQSHYQQVQRQRVLINKEEIKRCTVI